TCCGSQLHRWALAEGARRANDRPLGTQQRQHESDRAGSPQEPACVQGRHPRQRHILDQVEREPQHRHPRLLASRQRTTIIIAQRLSTIRDADRIVVLSHGSVLEDGTHDSLFKIEDGHYKALVDAQLRECRLAKGVYPMVVLVCRDPCCDALRHVHIGDLLVEINGRDTAMMSVKKTVGFCENVHQDRLAQV
ncbi:hypothetical protein H257_19343, partial [Aphanomyces astaci]